MPSGLNGRAEMRALPFEHLRAPPARSETTASRRCSARPRAESLSAQTRARRRSRAARAIRASPLAAAHEGRACRPTRRPRRPARARRDRSSAAWRRWRASRLSPVGIGRHHLAVVAAGDDARAVGRRRQDAAGVHGTRRCVAVRRDQQQRLLAEHEDRRAAEEMRGDHRRARRDGARALDEGDGVAAALDWSASEGKGASGSIRQFSAAALRRGAVKAADDEPGEVIKPRSSRSPCGSSPRAGCGR